jgi:two-component system sensor histidine kinase CssS
LKNDFKDEDFKFKEVVCLDKVINASIEKFKHKNDKVKIIKSIDKNNNFLGTEDIWETILDNILNNFYRYALKEIRITVKNNKLILYNDGPNIDDDYLDIIFVPFRKGIKGEFGFGLSIVKKSLVMMGYDIEVKNHNKKGLSFIISKKGS